MYIYIYIYNIILYYIYIYIYIILYYIYIYSVLSNPLMLNVQKWSDMILKILQHFHQKVKTISFKVLMYGSTTSFHTRMTWSRTLFAICILHLVKFPFDLRIS